MFRVFVSAATRKLSYGIENPDDFEDQRSYQLKNSQNGKGNGKYKHGNNGRNNKRGYYSTRQQELEITAEQSDARLKFNALFANLR